MATSLARTPTAIAPQFLAVNTAISGNTTLVAAVAGSQVVVQQFGLIAGGSVTVKFSDGAGGADLCGPMPLAANSGFGSPESLVGIMATTANTALVLNTNAAVQVSGWLRYYLLSTT